MDAYTSWKNENTLTNAKKQQPTENQKNTKYQSWPKCQLKGAQFLHLACQGKRLAPLPPVSYATGYNHTRNFEY